VHGLGSMAFGLAVQKFLNIVIVVSFLFASSFSWAYSEKLSAYECDFDPFDNAKDFFAEN
jgi:NADH:ubiquinone oxidoreductase subunit 3 (subunit A)